MTLEDQLIMFLWGFIGSFGVEIVKIIFVYERGRTLPSRYSDKGFWVARTCLAFLAGGIVLAHEAKNPWLAIHLGASTPLILQSFWEEAPASISIRSSPLSQPDPEDPPSAAR